MIVFSCCPQLRGGCGFGELGECSEGCCHGRGGNFSHAGGEPIIENCNSIPNYGGNPLQGDKVENVQEVKYMQGRNSMQGGNAIPGSYSVEGGTAHNASPNMQQGMTNSYIQRGIANANMQQGMTHPNPCQTGIFNPASQQIASGSHSYGQHTEGIQNLSEMFPGVISGNLGFNPMAIAVQMNPDNKKIAAIYQKNQMKKIMGGNNEHLSHNLAGGNATTTNFARGNAPITNQQNVQSPNHQTLYGQPQNHQYSGNMNATATPAYPNQQQVYYENIRAPQQPVYTGAPVSNQEQVPPQRKDQYQYQQHKMVDLSAGAPLICPAMNQEALVVNIQQQGQGNTTKLAPEPQLMKKNPILPVDTSRQMVCEYNTLGQPVYFLPAITHSTTKTHQPQTLSPQAPSGKFPKDISNQHVKSIMSKTSLMGNEPVGLVDQAIVETVGGDTAANNQPIHDLPLVNEQPIIQYDDVPAANKPNMNMAQTKVRTISQNKSELKLMAQRKKVH